MHKLARKTKTAIGDDRGQFVLYQNKIVKILHFSGVASVGIFCLYFRFANLYYYNYKSMTKIKFSIILIFAFCLSTSVLTTSPNSAFCDATPGTTALEPNFVKKN